MSASENSLHMLLDVGHRCKKARCAGCKKAMEMATVKFAKMVSGILNPNPAETDSYDGVKMGQCLGCTPCS